MNIYCFPYAGGSSFMYSGLKKKLANIHKIIPMEYPGHGFRIGEELTDSPDVIIEDMYDQIKKKDNGEPFILLGYSLGSKLVYLLYEKYKDNEMFSRLKALFFCASTMTFSEEEMDYSSMTDDELMDYTLSLGGSKVESEEEREEYRFFLPTIRNDFILYEKTKKMIAGTEYEAIDRKVCVLYSSDEENIQGYDKLCCEQPDYEYFSDGHFFIHKHCDEMAEYIIEKANESVEERKRERLLRNST